MGIKNNLEQFVSLLPQIIEKHKNPDSIDASVSQRFNEIVESIYLYLLSNPAGIIKVNSKEEANKYKSSIAFIDMLYDDDEFFDIIHSTTDIFPPDESYEYTSRIRKLTPTFIEIDPSFKSFNVFYMEAMKCWLYGLDNSAVILSATLIENALKDTIKEGKEKFVELIVKDTGPTGGYFYFLDLINHANDLKLINDKSRSKAHNLRKTRNKIVHYAEEVTYTISLALIKESKEIIEDLYSQTTSLKW